MKLDHTFNDVSFCLGFIVHDSRPQDCSFTAALAFVMHAVKFLKNIFFTVPDDAFVKKKTLPLNSKFSPDLLNFLFLF